MNRTVAFRLVAGLWILASALGAGCGGDDDDSGHREEDVGMASGADCPAGSTLTYDNFGQNFFSSYCLRCHSEKVKGDKRMGAPADHNFDTLAEIDLLSKHVDQMAASGPNGTNDKMPASDPKPSVDDRKKLGEWIACGVPEK